MNTTLLAALALGGAALSVKKPPQHHNLMRLPSFRGIAEVRASLPGRLRLYLPAVSANREAAAEMKRQLEATGVVHEVALTSACLPFSFATTRRRSKPPWCRARC